MKILLIILFLLTTSCAEIAEDILCRPPSYQEQENARLLYGEDMFASSVHLTYEEGRKIFGCNYSAGDYVYTYSRLYDEGYILVRGNNAITYKEKSR